MDEDEAIALAKQYFTSIERIDEDVLAKLKAANVSYIPAIKAIMRSAGVSLAEATQIASTSKYYAEAYKHSEALTQSIFNELEEMAKTDDSITLTDNGVSIDLTKLRDEHLA